MYCPECEGEYREGFKVYADCGVELIERPEEAAPLPSLLFSPALYGIAVEGW